MRRSFKLALAVSVAVSLVTASPQAGAQQIVHDPTAYATRDEMERLVGRSQSAEGALQATQAGNQLLALQAKQLAELSALMAAQGRAEALEAADRAATRAQAHERFRRFMGEPRR